MTIGESVGIAFDFLIKWSIKISIIYLEIWKVIGMVLGVIVFIYLMWIFIDKTTIYSKG